MQVLDHCRRYVGKVRSRERHLSTAGPDPFVEARCEMRRRGLEARRPDPQAMDAKRYRELIDKVVSRKFHWLPPGELVTGPDDSARSARTTRGTRAQPTRCTRRHTSSDRGENGLRSRPPAQRHGA